ncbi:MAG: endonuclease domain-containing protein [Chloroflexota bacterium]|nr:endonuclease domain-containing protein [Chloroflexota bacterium]
MASHGGSNEPAFLGRLQRSRPKRQETTQAARDFRTIATPSEALLWRALRNRQLDGIRFRRQHPIGPFVTDFCCPDRRLIVEVDGAIHRGQLEQDRQRQQILEAQGYRFLRATAEDVEQNLPSVLNQIRAALREPHTTSQ